MFKNDILSLDILNLDSCFGNWNDKFRFKFKFNNAENSPNRIPVKKFIQQRPWVGFINLSNRDLGKLKKV